MFTERVIILKTYDLKSMTAIESRELKSVLEKKKKMYLLLCLTLILNPIFAGAALKAENYLQYLQSNGRHTSSFGFRLVIFLISGPFGFIFWWLFEFTPLGQLVIGAKIR